MFKFASLAACAKTLAFRHKIMEIAAYIIVGVFNEVFFDILKIMKTVEIKIDTQYKSFAEKYISNRVKRQEG